MTANSQPVGHPAEIPSLESYLQQSIAVLQRLRDSEAVARTEAAARALIAVLKTGAPVLVCGNGGSASDAQHITAELVGRYQLERRALNVICLADNAAVLTAWSNDYQYETVFARQVEAYGRRDGAVIGLSTSGNSMNVVRALEAARGLGMMTVAMTGEGGGRLAPLADHLLAVPSRATPLIQQGHICLYHHLCARIEAAFAA